MFSIEPKTHFSQLFILFFMTGIAQISYGQLTPESSKVLYQIKVNEVKWNTGPTFYNDDDPGAEEPNFHIAIRTDENNQYDDIMDIADVNNLVQTNRPTIPFGMGIGSGYQWIDELDIAQPFCHTSAGCGLTSLNKEVFKLTSVGTDRTYFDWQVFSYERDGGVDSPYDKYTTGDTRPAAAWGLLSIKSGNPTQLWSDTLRVNNINSGSYVQILRTWRYANGFNKANPLDFGLIDNTTKSNLINVAAAPSGFDAAMGYVANEVWYTFQVPAGGKKINIRNEQFVTNFNFRLESSNGTLIANGYEINKELCEGTYFFRVTKAFDDSTKGQIFIEGSNIILNTGVIANSGSSSICEGILIPAITSQTDATAGSADVTYKWYKIVNFGLVAPPPTWQEIIGATDRSLPSTPEGTGYMPSEIEGFERVNFARVATVCETGATIWSNQIGFTSPFSNVSPGSIKLNESFSDLGTIGMAPGAYPGIFGSNDISGTFDDGNGSPTPITYRYELSSDDGNTWAIKGNSSAWDPTGADFNQAGTYKIRRIAINGCGQEASSNIISLIVHPKISTIKGKITSPPPGSQTGIDSVYVCATPLDAVPGVDMRCTYSENDGSYTIDSLYYGSQSVRYEVKPALGDHIIRKFNTNDSTITVTLKPDSPVAMNVNFVDLTVFTVSGNVYQHLDNYEIDKTYGKNQVKIYLKEQGGAAETHETTTDNDGNYSLVVNNAGTWTIRPELNAPAGEGMNHGFLPASRTLLILDNTEDVNFEDTTTMRIQGFVGAGNSDCKKFLGTIPLRFKDNPPSGSFNEVLRTIDLPGATENFNFILPAREYTVEVATGPIQNFDPDGIGYPLAEVDNQYSTFIFNAMLSHRDTSFGLYFRSAPVIQMEGIPDVLTNCVSTIYNYPYMVQGESYPDFKLTVWQGAIGECKLDTGIISINDDIGDRGSGVFPISKGKVDFLLYAGDPNVDTTGSEPRHLKNITFNAQTLSPILNGQTELVGIVVGEKPRAFETETVSPEIPLMILHDPPGDQSYSEIIQNEVFQTSMRNYSKKANSNGSWKVTKNGSAQSIGFGSIATVSYDVESWGTGESNFTTSEMKTSTEESIISMSSSTTISSKLAQDGISTLIFDEGDIFIGGAFVFKYALTDVLRIDPANCSIEKDIDFALEPDSLATTFIKTTRGIENTINNLRALKTIVPDSANYYQNQINVWEQTLKSNRDRKNRTINDPSLKRGSYNLDGGITYTESETYMDSKNASIEYWLEIDQGTAEESKIEAAGNGLNKKKFLQFKSETGESSTSDTTKSFTSTFHLSDDDNDDNLDIEWYVDPVYKTPIFKWYGGRTSCPYEGEFDPLDKILLNYSPGFPNTLFDVATSGPNAGARFKLKISNTGAFTRNYTIRSDGRYNKDGARIEIQGFSSGLSYPINNLGPGESQEFTVDVFKSSTSDVFSYPNLRIIAEPECAKEGGGDELIQTFRELSVFFQTTCSSIILEDTRTVTNLSHNNLLQIHFTGYDKTKLDRVQLEYTKKGLGDWQSSALLLTKDDPMLSSLASGTAINWDLNEIAEDGAYELRMKLVCSSGTTYSQSKSIVIDRVKPRRFGNPEPIDDHYQQGDEVSVIFDEEITCNAATMATLQDQSSGNSLSASINCIGNKIVIIPSENLALRPASAYIVSLINVMDLHGNTSDKTEWIFTTGDYEYIEPICPAELSINNNNLNLDGISPTEYRALYIQSSGQVLGFGTTKFASQSEVKLDVGFEVGNGGIFEAQIEDCMNE